MKVCVLGSGSSGNSTLVTAGETRLLVDAGFSVRDLTARLASIGECPEKLTAVLVTHEHSDHVAGLVRLLRKCPVPLYMTPRTAAQIEWDGLQPRLEAFDAGRRFAIEEIEVDSFTIPHDAIDPVGFCFRSGGRKASLVTDLGYMPDSVKMHIRDSHFLLLESNHDLEMLKVGPYPWVVKQRVMGRMGHLSNGLVCDYLREEFDGAPAELVLGHLSAQNNHPEIVRMGAMEELDARRLSTRLTIASQKSPTEVFEI